MIDRSGIFPSGTDLCFDAHRQLETTKDVQLGSVSKFAFLERDKERVKMNEPKNATEVKSPKLGFILECAGPKDSDPI
jgi:hypothetical protein